jgi:hypothetical protein
LTRSALLAITLSERCEASRAGPLGAGQMQRVAGADAARGVEREQRGAVEVRGLDG